MGVDLGQPHSLLPALPLTAGALREHTPGEDMQEAEGSFKCDRQRNGSCGVPGPAGSGEVVVVTSTVSGASGEM